jgi:hypothetical protein
MIITAFLGILLCVSVLLKEPITPLSVHFIMCWIIDSIYGLSIGEPQILTALTLLTASMVIQDKIDEDVTEMTKFALIFNIISMVIEQER